MLRRVVWYKFTDFSDMLAASIIRAIALMMETASTKMSENFCQTTRRNKPEDSHLHTRRRENLKSHITKILQEVITVGVALAGIAHP
jgi:hypothetical protein